MREKDPSGYIRAICSLMPKELEFKHPLDEMSEDELRAAIDALNRYLAEQGTGQRDGG